MRRTLPSPNSKSFILKWDQWEWAHWIVNLLSVFQVSYFANYSFDNVLRCHAVHKLPFHAKLTTQRYNGLKGRTEKYTHKYTTHRGFECIDYAQLVFPKNDHIGLACIPSIQMLLLRVPKQTKKAVCDQVCGSQRKLCESSSSLKVKKDPFLVCANKAVITTTLTVTQDIVAEQLQFNNQSSRDQTLWRHKRFWELPSSKHKTKPQHALACLHLLPWHHRLTIELCTQLFVCTAHARFQCYWSTK